MIIFLNLKILAKKKIKMTYKMIKYQQNKKEKLSLK
jgi:hypothetical protein